MYEGRRVYRPDRFTSGGGEGGRDSLPTMTLCLRWAGKLALSGSRPGTGVEAAQIGAGRVDNFRPNNLSSAKLIQKIGQNGEYYRILLN